jgi:hypothetical protein
MIAPNKSLQRMPGERSGCRAGRPWPGTAEFRRPVRWPMRVITLFLVAVTFCVTGCASSPVPLPVRTPYDESSSARSAYLTFYADGYREPLAGTLSTCCLLDCPDRGARIAGWYDGQTAGLQKHRNSMFRRVEARESALSTEPKDAPSPAMDAPVPSHAPLAPGR